MISKGKNKPPCGKKCVSPTVCGDLLGGKCALDYMKNKQEDTPKKPGNVTGKKR